MSRAGLSCSEFVESVSDWLEGALGNEARSAVESHLLVCPSCSDYLDELRRALRTLRFADEQRLVAPPPGARDALLEMFRREHPAASSDG